jgi:hypothetical protein
MAAEDEGLTSTVRSAMPEPLRFPSLSYRAENEAIPKLIMIAAEQSPVQTKWTSKPTGSRDVSVCLLSAEVDFALSMAKPDNSG